MWGKDKKTTYFDFLPYECKAAEEYLEDMAENGWLLQSIKGAFFKFKRIEPAKIKYSVDVYHKISELDHNDSQIALERRENYKSAGWNYVCQKEKIQVFYTEDYENRMPIHNEGEKFKSIFKASLSRIISPLILTILFIINLYMQLSAGSIDYTLATNIGILSILTIVFLAFINTILIVSFFIWAIKSLVRLRKGKSMAYKSSRQVRSKNIFISLFDILLIVALIQTLIFNSRDSQILGISILLIMLISAIPIIFVRILINKKRYSKNTNLAIYTVSFIAAILLLVGLFRFIVFRDITRFEQSETPTENTILTLKDFEKYQNNTENAYVKIDKSILAKRINYSWGNYKDTLMYTCFESQFPWILKLDENSVISRLNKYGYDLKQIDSKLPGNIKIYKGNNNKSFVLVSEDKVVDIRKGFDDIDDEEFLSLVYSKLFKD